MSGNHSGSTGHGGQEGGAARKKISKTQRSRLCCSLRVDCRPCSGEGRLVVKVIPSHQHRATAFGRESEGRGRKSGALQSEQSALTALPQWSFTATILRHRFDCQKPFGSAQALAEGWTSQERCPTGEAAVTV